MKMIFSIALSAVLAAQPLMATKYEPEPPVVVEEPETNGGSDVNIGGIVGLLVVIGIATWLAGRDKTPQNCTAITDQTYHGDKAEVMGQGTTC